MTKGWYNESHRHALAAMQGWKGNRSQRRLAIDRSKKAKTIFSSRKKWLKTRGRADLRGYDTPRLQRKVFVAREDIPAFIGTDMKEYGGFKPGQKVVVPEKVRELLEKRKLAVYTTNPEKFKVKETPMQKLAKEYDAKLEGKPELEKKYLVFLREKQKDLDMLPLQDIADELNISREKVGEITQSLAKKGDIYQPRFGFARLTGR